MKSRQRISAKRYRIVFGKQQAGVFSLILLVGMGACFGLGYFWGARGVSSEMARAEVEPEILKKDSGEDEKRTAVAALPKMPETKPEVSDKPADVIKPKFYQDLLKESQENEQPIEPIKLPVVRKKEPPKPATPPLVAAVEEPLDKKVTEKKRDTDGLDGETRKRSEAAPRASKPWTKASGYTIQVVSVKKFDEALRVVRKLRDAGFQPFIKNAELGVKGKWYRVRVGNYRDRAEAQKALSEMQARIRLQWAQVIAM